jgi:hypothetical protein
MKRRNHSYNQSFQAAPSSMTNNRLKKFNIINNNSKSNQTGYANGANPQPHGQHDNAQQNFQQSTNGHHDDSKETTKSNGGYTDLSIDENGANDQARTTTPINNNNNDHNNNAKFRSNPVTSSSAVNYNLKNYDNLSVTSSSNNNKTPDAANTDQDKIEINVGKDERYQDFGFSLSKSLHGNGIYVDKIRSGSPAENNLYLKPNTRLFKVFIPVFEY